MQFYHIKLDKDSLIDVFLLCPTCGHFHEVFPETPLSEISNFIENAHVKLICNNCNGGKHNFPLAWFFIPALGDFVHPNCVALAPHLEALRLMYDERRACNCKKSTTLGHFVSYENLPILCSFCGLLYFPHEFISNAYNIDKFSFLIGAQMKQINYDMRPITIDKKLLSAPKRRKITKGSFFRKKWLMGFFEERLNFWNPRKTKILIGARPEIYAGPEIEEAFEGIDFGRKIPEQEKSIEKPI